MSEQQDDLFDDQPSTQGEGESKTFDQVTKPEEASVAQSEEGQSGDKEVPTEPPSEGQEDQKAAKTEKMIPESRFKAALKDATDKLEAERSAREAADAELNKLKATPVPDKEQDPEGYDLHIRMEASKAAMRATHDDYQEVITHYAEMAKVNPLLNEAVAKHPVPAKYAYELAKEDIRIQELRNLKDSDEWKEFQEWRKNKPTNSEEPKLTEAPISAKLAEGAPKVPNLNRATSITKEHPKVQEDDELFAGSL